MVSGPLHGRRILQDFKIKVYIRNFKNVSSGSLFIGQLIRPKTVTGDIYTLKNKLKGIVIMRKVDLLAKGLTEEQIKYVFSQNGKDINAEKKKNDNLVKELAELKKELTNAETNYIKYGVDVSKELETQNNREDSNLLEVEFERHCINFQKKNDSIKIQITLPFPNKK